MASSARVKKAEGKSGMNKNSIEVFSWLKTLPLAPEYHPTLAEFQDPIAFIHKIEKEASKYGICKIIPPVSQPSKKDTISNLNKSLLARSGNFSPTFTTRQQQVGFCPRKQRPVKKPVWQSGETYTVPEFEAKAKLFEKGYLKRVAKKALSPLEVETLYWKATLDKPFSVEYANDMPGSAFVPLSGKKRVAGEGLTVGETPWNMRGVSRSDGSLLKFMKEEIPGVTSPMVYLAMMFSWFAWHVEDHDLHSLNYMHMGAGKTWYGVPREAAVAFEDVIKVHGYGGEINPIVTFATLGEKTTVMSPEVLVKAGVPCCRLVQNAGEFVVTFPRAYHSGFSHGFNCGEASNIATPEWVRLARDAAIRRASVNSPPMVSHHQLLYDLALSLSTRVPMTTVPEPRSSRLKDKKKGEGETLVKELFVHDVMENIELLNTLGKGSPIVLLPRDFIQTQSRAGYLIKANSDLSLGLCSTDRKMRVLNDIKLDRKKRSKGPYSMKGKFPKSSGENRLPFFGGSNGESCESLYENESTDTEGERRAQCDRLPNKGLFSCVTCGILCFACIAIVKPRDVASRYLKSSNCTNFTEWGNGSKVDSKCLTLLDGNAETAELSTGLGWITKKSRNGLVDVPRESVEEGYIETTNGTGGMNAYAETHIGNSSLGLLALTYGDSSDSDEDDQCEAPVNANKTEFSNFSAVNSLDSDDSGSPCHAHYSGPSGRFISFPLHSCEDEDPRQIIDSYEEHGHARSDLEDRCYQTSNCSFGFQTNNPSLMADSFKGGSSHLAHTTERSCGSDPRPIDNRTMSFASRADEDSSRYHVFCLQHAAEIEQKLRSVGGVHLLLLCHPDYPKYQAEAKLMADELGSNHIGNDITFRQATEDEKEKVKSALHSEESIHGNGDWAVKLDMNLFYSANLSRSPLYNQQMPYNSVIYGAFGCSSSDNDPAEKLYGKGSGRQKKIVVAGKWCGKVWMSNQVHALLAGRDDEREKETSFLALPAPEHPKPSVNLEKPSKIHKMDTASVSSKVERKRKSNTEIRSASRAKSLKIEEPARVLDDAPDEKVIRQYKRNFRNKTKKEIKETPHHMDSCEQETKESTLHMEFLEGGPSTRLRKRTSQPPPENRAKLVKAKSVTKKRTSNIEETSQTTTENRAKAVEAKSVTKKKRSNTDGTTKENRGKLVEAKSVTKKQMSNKEKTPTENRVKLVEAKSVTKKQTSNTEETSQTPAENRAKLVEVKSVTKKQRSNTEGKKVPKIKASVGNSNKNRGSRNKVTDSSNKNTSSSNKNTGNSNKNLSDEEAEYACEIDGCSMSFSSKQELMQHKRNICPVKGCGKKFFSHKYLVQHRRVHVDDRPLQCPWKGCKMTFKWAWARTEHIRVHTGVRPYICNEDGCGQTFRFVSDFSRHKRKTGHSTKTTKKANK
ncbi:hypothetical protein ACET3Z_017184 [Daucus carota]